MIIAVDIDGILTNETEGWDYANRTPCHPAIRMVNKLFGEGHTIVLFTSRDIVDKHVTCSWLRNRSIQYHDIIFNKPKFDMLIDDKAFNNFADFWDHFNKVVPVWYDYLLCRSLRPTNKRRNVGEVD